MIKGKRSLADLISSLPYSYKVTGFSKEIRDKYASYEGKHVSVAGRVTAIRKSGKLIFVDILDSRGKIQVYFDYAEIGEKVFDSAKKLNAGDIIGVDGGVFKTKPGEISVRAGKYTLLAKAIRTLPDKWHGIQDVETRYRKRHLDLIMNEEVRETFVKRSRTISLIRKFLDGNGFIEFETPTIQPLYGGADAEPFKTHVNTLKEEHYLRISDEIYLKKLIIGGFDKVYEICKDFRNEDLDTTHSPEFTMIEWYQAYADYNDMMKLLEELLNYTAKELLGTHEITYQGKTVSLKAPFKRLRFVESIKEKTGKDILKLERRGAVQACGASRDKIREGEEEQGARLQQASRSCWCSRNWCSRHSSSTSQGRHHRSQGPRGGTRSWWKGSSCT